MTVYKQGFEGTIAYGTAGSTGSTVLENTRDIVETFEFKEGDSTTRGAGTSPPIEYSHVTGRSYGIDWSMPFKSDDASLLAMIVAAVAGTPVAIRTKSYSSGLGFDGDMILKFKHGKPLNGEQMIDFSGKPNNGTRASSLNV